MVTERDLIAARDALREAQQRAYRHPYWPLFVVGDDGLKEYQVPHDWLMALQMIRGNRIEREATE